LLFIELFSIRQLLTPYRIHKNRPKKLRQMACTGKKVEFYYRWDLNDKQGNFHYYQSFKNYKLLLKNLIS